jgi:hypothetical protein
MTFFDILDDAAALVSLALFLACMAVIGSLIAGA